MEKETTELEKIEQELTEMFDNDKKNWVTMAEKLIMIEEKRLYKDVANSFGGWVRTFAGRIGANASLIYRRKKAGLIYKEYFLRQSDQGNNPPTLLDASIPANALDAIQKITKHDPGETDKYINGYIMGQYDTATLTAIWEATKASRQTAKDNPDKMTDSHKYQTTAPDIIQALSNGMWLPEDLYEPYARENYRSDDVLVDYKANRIRNKQLMYKVIPEFTVRVSNDEVSHARRIDIMAAENYLVNHFDRDYRLNTHAIEIKVSKSDLLSDTKMHEYAQFADYAWLAVPTALECVALDYISSLLGWGLIVIDDHIMTLDKATEYYAEGSKYSIYAEMPPDDDAKDNKKNQKDNKKRTTKDTKVNVKIPRVVLRATKNNMQRSDYTRKVSLMTIISKYSSKISGQC